MPHLEEMHLDNLGSLSTTMHKLCVIMFERELLGSDATSWLQIQGPGWADEYIGKQGTDVYLPRMDVRRALLGFLQFNMPSPSRWENPDRAKLVADMATAGVLTNFSALHAHVVAAMSAKADHSGWNVEAVRQQCSAALAPPKIW